MLFEPSVSLLRPSDPFGLTGASAAAAAKGSISLVNGNAVGVKIEESCFREKRIQHSPDVEELIRALGGLSLDRDYWLQTADAVKSSDPIERFDGTKKFRMMLSVSGEIPIQDVIDTGVVPLFVKFLQSDDSSLQFEAAWALTNIASGTCQQTEEVVREGAVPRFLDLLDCPREDVREQGMWGLGNIAGDRPDFRDLILAYPMAMERFLNACRRSRHISTIRTGVWSLSNLCRGKPRPKYSVVAPVIPYLSMVLTYSSDPDTLSDACWALDGLSEHSGGVGSIIENGVLSQLIRLLSHSDLIVQRPALRVIGQVAAGDAEQTEEVLRVGSLGPLMELLASPRKSIRKDACWTFSNIAAGTASQLQMLLNGGAIPKLLFVFSADDELEVKKEAAWAICNACTAQRQDQMEYLVTGECTRPVCEMLSIDDPKILEVALEALDNILTFGERMSRNLGQQTNICMSLVKAAGGIQRLYDLHNVAQGYGSFAVWQKSGEILQRWFPEAEATECKSGVDGFC